MAAQADEGLDMAELVRALAGPVEGERRGALRELALRLLTSRNKVVSARAWAMAPRLVEAGVLALGDLKALKGELLSQLRWPPASQGACVDLWEAVAWLVEAGVLDPGEVRGHSASLWRLLDSATGADRERLLRIAEELRARGALSPRPLTSGWRVLSEDSVIL